MYIYTQFARKCRSVYFHTLTKSANIKEIDGSINKEN